MVSLYQNKEAALMNGSEQLAVFLCAVKDANVERDVPLAKHCTFRIGGNAAIYA